MFTGIIQDIGTVQSISNQQGDWRIIVQTNLDLTDKAIGASIACSGCCLTVVEKGEDWFAVDVSHESLSKTSIGKWGQGTKINIEPSLKLGDELGGHIVTGHVDGLARVETIKKSEDSHELWFSVSQDYAPFIAAKGSITINGISLTVNAVDGVKFSVNIIPHTWDVTTMHNLNEGDKVNFEIDTLARYIARQREFDALK